MHTIQWTTLYISVSYQINFLRKCCTNSKVANCCREILTNNNASFNDDGTVTFVPMREYQTDLENSASNAKLDRIIIPNIPLLVSLFLIYFLLKCIWLVVVFRTAEFYILQILEKYLKPCYKLL